MFCSIQSRRIPTLVSNESVKDNIITVTHNRNAHNAIFNIGQLLIFANTGNAALVHYKHRSFLIIELVVIIELVGIKFIVTFFKATTPLQCLCQTFRGIINITSQIANWQSKILSSICFSLITKIAEEPCIYISSITNILFGFIYKDNRKFTRLTFNNVNVIFCVLFHFANPFHHTSCQSSSLKSSSCLWRFHSFSIRVATQLA